MLILSLIFFLLSTSVTSRKDKSILYSRATITILLISLIITQDNLYFLFLNKGIGIFGGLFHSTSISTVFHAFILAISSVILVLTSFYPRKVWIKEYSSFDRLLFTKLIYYQTIILNKMGEQYKIIEYSLIILFIIIGSIFLISTSDLVSIFLSIELQSYGLYLLSTIYRDSEPATSGGLMYFLLGGLSSCFILLGTSLLYANSGTTNLDSLYIITSISNINEDNLSSLLYWYKSYYLHVGLLFMSVGFLFKVSAAPFHFWSPERWSGKSSPKILASSIRGKLPNSGETLELKIPSHNRKVIGGWTNYSCTVTSLKTSEKIGGNRGSKSVTVLSLYFYIHIIFFISLIIYLSVLHFHFLLYLNYTLLAILYFSYFYFYPLNFSSTLGSLIHDKPSIAALLRRKHLFYKKKKKVVLLNYP